MNASIDISQKSHKYELANWKITHNDILGGPKISLIDELFENKKRKHKNRVDSIVGDISDIESNRY